MSELGQTLEPTSEGGGPSLDPTLEPTVDATLETLEAALEASEVTLDSMVEHGGPRGP